MNLLCRFRIALPLLCLSLLAGQAQATHRADFFDITRSPNVGFDRGAMTWTLSNQAVSRVVQFDKKTGALRTTSLNDLKHGRSYQAVPKSEGSISFLPALMEPPQALTSGWRSTDVAPPSDWAQPEFKDTAWKPASLPFKTDEENKTWWFRYTIPATRMQGNHAYALLFDRALDDEAEIYIDGALAAKVSAAEQPWTRAYQFDLLPRNRVIAVKLIGHGKPNGLLGSVGIAEVGSAPQSLDLNGDWKYMLHSVNTGVDGSKILTISLAGLRRFEGFDLDVSYQIYSGDEPFIAKWFQLVSHRSTRFLVDQVTYDRWRLPGAKPETRAFPGTGFTASDPASRDGLLTAVLSTVGASERSEDGQSVATVLRPYYLIKPDTRQMMPKSLVGLYQGPTATGAFLYQLYTGQYVSHATPTSVPPLYNTWFGYYGDISAATCERIIPIAAELGVKLFVIDDGWQTNVPPDSGKYGDWVVDRRANKFPNGLLPISTLVRERDMRFGLWAAPIMVSEKSQAAVQHPEWLLRRADGSHVKEWDGTWGMCFTSGWEENYSKSLLDLCRELTVSYLKLDDGLFEDGCVDPTHDHPVGHSLALQATHWNAFCEKMRDLDPAFIVNRGWEGGPEVTAMQDEGWFGDWEIGYDPKRMTDARWWYKNADIYRRSLYDLTAARPPFTIAWETPCHIPTNPVDLNALEYHFTSIGAYICNVEIHGKLDEMKPEERRLLQKWIAWNTQNRPWLAYTQPLVTLGQPWDPRPADAKPHIDGVLHLRNAVEGRYGYVCLWNPGDQPDKAEIAFRPADYFVRMNLNNVQITRLKDGQPVKFGTRGDRITLPVSMPPLSWDIYEIRQGG